MRIRYTVAIVAIALLTSGGIVGLARASTGATPQASPATGAPTTLVLVERSLHTTNVRRNPATLAAGDMVVWGPNPVYDATNTTDTGATTQGYRVYLNAAGASVGNETLVFPDGSTLETQGSAPSAQVMTSTRTIIGGSGRYRGATGTETVQGAADHSTWTETYHIWP